MNRIVPVLFGAAAINLMAVWLSRPKQKPIVLPPSLATNRNMVINGHSYRSQHPATIHFGLGT